jgi:HSP20 family protein
MVKETAKEEAKEGAKKEIVASEQKLPFPTFWNMDRWPADAFRKPFWNMDRWLAEAFRKPFTHVNFPGFVSTEDIIPDVDIYEDGGDVVVKAELPGIKKDDLDVTLTDDAITISGEKRKEEKIQKKGYYKWERSYGSFCRTFSLPAEIHVDKVKSTFKDGVLEVRISKIEKAKSKEVKVKVD